jgi:hypothetical protein
MNLKPYSEPCFRHFSGAAIIDVCTEVRVLQFKEELIERFRIFFGTHRVVSYNNTIDKRVKTCKQFHDLNVL